MPREPWHVRYPEWIAPLVMVVGIGLGMGIGAIIFLLEKGS